MADHKLPPPRSAVHYCPVCNHPQTRIQRKSMEHTQGPVNYVCTRTECVVGINLAMVDTWIAV